VGAVPVAHIRRRAVDGADRELVYARTRTELARAVVVLVEAAAFRAESAAAKYRAFREADSGAVEGVAFAGGEGRPAEQGALNKGQ
jgi:hypothetical protein